MDKQKLKCQNCDYIWNYLGQSNYYTSCPRCNFKVNIKKRRVEVLENGRE